MSSAAQGIREIVLDTETTGFDPYAGHRMVEIGCVELIDHLPTGNNYHQYINPERDMPEEAFKVHGLSTDYLRQFPTFKEVVNDFLEFIGDEAILVIHNASFDMNFINHHLEELKLPTVPMERSLDTVAMARKKFPGSQVNLDALCRRFEIDNTNRTLHGALLDSELLAEVYLELIGGRQPGLVLDASQDDDDQAVKIERVAREARSFEIPAEELEAHQAFLDKMVKDPLWTRAAEPDTEKA